jgi:hypothetical protein
VVLAILPSIVGDMADPSFVAVRAAVERSAILLLSRS